MISYKYNNIQSENIIIIYYNINIILLDNIVQTLWKEILFHENYLSLRLRRRVMFFGWVGFQ